MHACVLNLLCLYFLIFAICLNNAYSFFTQAAISKIILPLVACLSTEFHYTPFLRKTVDRLSCKFLPN